LRTSIYTTTCFSIETFHLLIPLLRYRDVQGNCRVNISPSKHVLRWHQVFCCYSSWTRPAWLFTTCTEPWARCWSQQWCL